MAQYLPICAVFLCVWLLRHAKKGSNKKGDDT
jgi:hypothetical protein